MLIFAPMNHQIPIDMKRTFTLLAVGLITLTMSSCGGGGSQPKDVARTFLDAMEEQDWETAKSVSTKETKKMLDSMKGLMSMGGNKDKSTTGKLEEFKNTEVNGDKAVVTYCCGKEGNDAKLHLKKVEGDWKVHLNKEMPNKGGSGGGSPSGPSS